ncbi:MAG: UDP-N-acetylglucosamine 2-epimerase (non-hydrolyzing) [Candidatus Omnitrophica bacterium]|nr:UDP-N-acetylglucosamine 2-epimerase (non-hydrolyzing) [Candidatus Omnitrophota bacterium]
MILSVVGARPNFVKMAPVVREISRRKLPHMLVHTGQHYSPEMSDVFFRDLDLQKPDMNLGAGSGSHASQTAEIMKAFEPVCAQAEPRIVIVAGDVNSTAACAWTAAKMQVPVAHIESGLRSFDRAMPEEINRVITDHLSSLLFATEPSARKNLLREGVDAAKIFDSGNTMIDSLIRGLEKALTRRAWERYGFREKSYALLTLHRPENVDRPSTLLELNRAVCQIASRIPVVFPIHPRTLQRIEVLGAEWSGVTLTEPLGYLDFLSLTAGSAFVMTDSGGLQEETSALAVPCITLRKNTERPVTLTQGTNRLCAVHEKKIIEQAFRILEEPRPVPTAIPLWDGGAAERIVSILEKFLAEGDSFGRA